ncbi:MAG: hypothetical protein FIA97_20120, partial [Methylococcaceae bacterium]|nr:hypothetical protein [Methylococcaceae bacterium]
MKPSQHSTGFHWGYFGVLAVGLALLSGNAFAGKPRLVVSKAVLIGGTLTVKGSYRNGSASSIALYDTAGQFLGAATIGDKGKFNFTAEQPQHPQQLCSVRAEADDQSTFKAVKGSGKQCAKTPVCKIVEPVENAAIGLNEPVALHASAALKDKKAAPLTVEWDFAGGALGIENSGTNPPSYTRGRKTTSKLRPLDSSASVNFVRDNSSYRIRFTAWDKLNRYCEDSVLILVGKSAERLPDISNLVSGSQSEAPTAQKQLQGNKGDVVVLPFPDLTMQSAGDARYTPNLDVAAAWGPFNSLNAVVYKKDLKPPQLTPPDDQQPDKESVKLTYAAANSPLDPVGTDSINSTSQNWPLNKNAEGKYDPAPLQGADIQKTDLWEVYERPKQEQASDYVTYNWLTEFLWWTGWGAKDPVLVKPDEGIRIWNPPNPYWTFPGGEPPAAPYADDHGRYMPGRADPFAVNTPQDFTTYYTDQAWHTARNIPLTDVDDSGRVNPYPLMRVEVADATSKEPLAKTDAVVSASKDFHCRECHAKGKIAANDQLDWSQYQKAYHSTGTGECTYQYNCKPEFTPPSFFESVDRDGKPSDSLFDQEYAAILNASALHDFYDNVNLVSSMIFGAKGPTDTGTHWDWPLTCTMCHQTMEQYEMGFNVNDSPGKKRGDPGFTPRYSQTMHRYHAQLRKDPSDPLKLQRGEDGRPLRWDPAKGPNPDSLFAAVDDQGNALPQEQSCLHCHAGHRDQVYRDRMYTAGVTCYDCHGDMFAVGQAYQKPKPGAEGFTSRIEYYDQPDCGSCHTGDANRGKDGSGGFYSAGVLKRAFAQDDPSATPLQPKSQRFAVQPGKSTDIYFSQSVFSDKYVGSRNSIVSVTTPLYRNSHDSHGNVPCGACHGGAHEVWPNRDPKANDNVTSMQLQGHTGPILECNVCHDRDSFKNEKDLDGGIYMTDLAADSGVLGGPHNSHPINDPYWWKSSGDPTDTTTIDGTTYGGWHNNYAQKPGKNHEDQCAACHGNDHKGPRLSKTPVDRVFDFSDFEWAKLKAAGFKKSVIKVAAGTEIGCDTCHDIKTSCTLSPVDKACGKASDAVTWPENHDPVITSNPGVTTGIMGAAYSYQVTASD